MTHSYSRHQIPQTRIINFSTVELSGDNLLSVEQQNAAEAVKHIRRYADLPYVYVVSSEQRSLVSDILDRLKAMRSNCYPYALLVTDGDLSFDGTRDLDILKPEVVTAETIIEEISRYASSKLIFDKSRLQINNPAPPPDQVDVLIIGGGITALYAANRLAEKQISFFDFRIPQKNHLFLS